MSASAAGGAEVAVRLYVRDGAVGQDAPHVTVGFRLTDDRAKPKEPGVFDDGSIDASCVAALKRRVEDPTRVWIPGLGPSGPAEDVVPVPWPATTGVYVCVANSFFRRRTSREGVAQIFRNQIATVDRLDFRVVCGLFLHATDADALARVGDLVGPIKIEDWLVLMSRPTHSDPMGLVVVQASRVSGVRPV